MNKYLILSIIACALASSNTSFSMFKFLRTQRQRPYTRMCHMSRLIGSSPKKNIHNSSEIEISANAGVLLEDMYQRNQKLAELLQQQIERNQQLLENIKEQNRAAINYTFSGEILDISELKIREENIRKLAQNDFYSLFSEKKYRGHADE